MKWGDGKMKKPRLYSYTEISFKYKGYNCAVVAHHHGHRCGYVCLPKTSRFYNVDYSKIDVDVHGGLTYGSESYSHPIATKEHVYWIGFDCAHLYDSPDEEILRKFGELNDEPEYYREVLRSGSYHRYDSSVKSQYYVECEIKSMVDQIIELEGLNERT